MKLLIKKEEEEIFEKEMEDGDLVVKPFQVDCLPNDYNISVLMNLIQRGYLKIPSFQRNYVWNKEMASKFIESIIIGLPIPQIFLFEQSRNDFLVVDGQQRIVTIYLFKKKRFPKNDLGRAVIRKYLSSGTEIPAYELSGTDFEDFNLKLPSRSEERNPLNSKNYDTLPTENGFDFKANFDFNRTIRTMTIRQIEPEHDESSMYEIFSRLNSGGVTLKPQEIRMSLFYSLFFETTLEMNKNDLWRMFLGKKEPLLHMNDVEVLLRSFAMLEMHDQYKSPMKAFLNMFSEKAKKFSDEKIIELQILFDQFWESCEGLDKNSFKNENGKFVISHFEAVFVAVCEQIRNEGLNGRSIDPKSLSALKDDAEFFNASQQRTAENKHVKTRIMKAKTYIVLR